jgi:hypothetical protein
MVLCALMLFYVNIGPTPGGDFWLHARLGKLIVANHAIPGTMLFPFTEIATDTFNAHEWLASILFHSTISLIGERNLPFALGLLGVIYYAIVCALVCARGAKNIQMVLLLSLVALLTERERHTLRPEHVSLVLMVGFWYCLEKFRISNKALDGMCAALLCVLWVNCHGSFILAPLLAGLYMLGGYLDHCLSTSWKILRPPSPTLCLLALFLVTLGACLVNPFGTDLVSFVLDFSTHNQLGNILGEWTPSWDRRLWGYSGLWYALLVWLFTLGLMVTNRSNLSAIEILVFMAFTLLQQYFPIQV